MTVSSEDNISQRRKRIGCSGVGLFNYLEGFFLKLLRALVLWWFSLLEFFLY